MFLRAYQVAHHRAIKAYVVDIDTAAADNR
ncbi:hypothetical protein BX283_7751 [Streptomyces sp. TLI_146]|nr:hypothetical protein BX283_7751 [Streptomyces sp. TLI_146]